MRNFLPMMLVATGLCGASLLAGTMLTPNTLLQQAGDLIGFDGLPVGSLQRLAPDAQGGGGGRQMARSLDDTAASVVTAATH
jgi:hypothetical protein